MRSCEGILEAVKPFLIENRLALTISDEIVEIGNRIYVKATARLCDLDMRDSGEIITNAFAREEETKKGMDASQVTGAASSYARKYALNGLFCIDDNKDSDATNHGDEKEKPKTENERQTAPERQQDRKAEQSNGYVCSACGAEISEKVYKFSKDRYKRPLCMTCQKREG